MKNWIGLSIVFLVIVLCGYYGMGVGTEKILKRNITVLNQSDGVTFSLQKYERGWFRSHANLRWTIAVPQDSSDQPLRRTVFTDKKIYTFETPLEIYHGPMMWVNSRLFFGLGYGHATVQIPTELQKELNQTYKFTAKKLEGSIHVLVNYLNKITVQFQVPQYLLSAKQGNNFFECLGINIVASGDKQHLEGSMLLKGLSWYQEPIKGILGTVKAKYDMKQGLDGLYVGSSHFMLPSMVVFDKAQPIFRVTDVQADSSSDIQNGLFNTTFSAKVNQLILKDKVYSQNSFDLSIQNLDAKVLAVMNQKFNELQHNNSDGQRILWALIPDLPAVLSKGAQLSIENFEINTLQGRIKTNLNLSLPTEKMTNPLQLVQKLKGESHIRVSKAVLCHWVEKWMKKAVVAQAQKQSLAKEMQVPIATEASPVHHQAPRLPSMTTIEHSDTIADTQIATKAAEKIQEWIHEGVLIEEGTDYVILLRLMDGKLFINEHLFNPALLAA